MQIYKDLFSQRFKEARRRSGLKQWEIAEKVGVEPSTVSRWETGADMPDDTRLPEICNALGIPLSYFSDASTKPTPPQPDPSWQELSRFVQHYLDAEPERRLLALYILTDDESYLTQYESLPSAPRIAGALKKVL